MSAHIRACELPADVLLARYRRDGGGYTDCYATRVAGPVAHAAFVEAFYTSWLFKLERRVLAWRSLPSTDVQAAELASGRRETFAAWRVEARSADQLLMCDLSGRTRSWLMTHADGTLYFGSAVVPAPGRPAGASALGFPYRQLLGFHRLYSRALLRAAAARVEAASPRLQ